MKRKQIILAFVFLAFFNVFGFASTVGEVEYECPVCHAKFKYRVQFSYSIFGQNLDLKPVGAAIIPTPIPKCEECGLVFDKDLFTEDEIKKLEDYLTDNKLPDYDKDYPNYYYLAQEMFLLDAPIEEVAWVFLESVWENKEDGDKEFLLSNALKYLNAVPKTSDSYATCLMVRIDLERRLSNFDNALNLISELKTLKDFYKDYIIKIAEYQEKLIAEKDTGEHLLP